MRTGLDAFTLRIPRIAPATPLLATFAGLTTGSAVAMLAAPGLLSMSALIGSSLLSCFVLLVVVHRADRLRAIVHRAMVGLTPPRGGWNPLDQRAIRRMQSRNLFVQSQLDGQTLAGFGGTLIALALGLSPLILVIAGLVTSTGHTANTGTMGIGFTVGMIASVTLVVLALGWRVDLMLRSDSARLGRTIAARQRALLEGS